MIDIKESAFIKKYITSATKFVTEFADSELFFEQAGFSKKKLLFRKNSKVFQQILVYHGHLEILEELEKLENFYLVEFIGRIFFKDDICGVAS